MEFSKTTCKAISDRIKKVLEKEFEKEGFKVTFKGGKFDTLSFLPNLQLEIESANGMTKAQMDFENEMRLNGWFHNYLLPEDFGAVIKSGPQSTQYKIIGYKPRARKKTILIQQLNNGIVYRIDAVEVAMCLHRKPPELTIATESLLETVDVAISSIDGMD